MGTGCSVTNEVIRTSATSLQDDTGVPYKIVVHGPSNVGKTFILYSWLLGVDGVHSTKPTEEFNVETVRINSGISFTMWDVSGNPTFRPHLKRKFNEGAQGIVFVFNVNEDVKIAREDLQLVLEDQFLRNVPLLLVANKLNHEDANIADDSLNKLTDNKSVLRDREWRFSKVRLKSQDDVDCALLDLRRLVDKR